MDIPTKPELITKEWMMMVINNYRDKKNLSLLGSAKDVTSIELQQIETNGILSSSFLAHVKFNCFTSMGTESFEHKFVIKMASDNTTGHKIAVESRLMEREVQTYLRLVPRMKMSLESPELALPLIEPIFGAYNAQGEGVLVSFEIRKNNYKLRSIAQEPNMNTVSKIMMNLARFHSTTAAYINKVGHEQFLKEFPHLDGPIYSNESVFTQVMKELQEFSYLIRSVPGFYTQFEQYEEWRSDAWDVLSPASPSSGSLKCVVHGNFSLNEVMSDEDEMIFTSLSRNYLGSPVIDIATLLFTACDAKMRRENCTKLLETYLTSFSENLKSLGLDLDNTFPHFNLKFLSTELEKCRYEGLIKSSLILMSEIKSLQKKFNNDPDTSCNGLQLRDVSRRALELVDEAYLGHWRSPSTCQVESSSMTIKIPSR